MMKSALQAIVLTLLCVIASAGVAQAPSTGSGQAWPSKPIRYVVPFPPAGATDILARIVAEKISPVLGVQVVVENRPGAAGNLGTELVARSAPDGNTILMATAALSDAARNTDR